MLLNSIVNSFSFTSLVESSKQPIRTSIFDLEKKSHFPLSLAQFIRVDILAKKKNIYI